MTGLFWKGVALALVGSVLCRGLQTAQKEIGTLLAMGICLAIAGIAAAFLEPIVALLGDLEQLGGLDGDIPKLLLKALGLSLVSELAATVCADSGNGALGKLLTFLGTAAVLYISLPLITSLTDFLREILGEL